jgi:hypothetical protein
MELSYVLGQERPFCQLKFKNNLSRLNLVETWT